MRVNGKAILGLMALGFTLCAVPASAVTRCVNPAGTSPCLKFQAAVDASGPGDTITVYAGTYTGTALSPNGYIYVGYGKDGLKIIGSGLVVIDVEFGTGNLLVDAIDVYSSFVSISNITIRNGNYGIYADWGTGLTLTGVKILGAQNDCVYLWYHDFATIKGLKCIASGGDGITAYYSDYLTATGNTFSQVDNGLNLNYGNNPTFSSNMVLISDREAIYVNGTCCSENFGGTFKTNTITDSDNEGIEINYQNGVNVSGNKLTNIDSTAIYTYYSENPIVSSNIINNVDSYGIEVYGAAAQIKSNTINNVSSTAIYLTSGNTDADSGVISLNKITAHPGADGIYNDGSHVTISSNIISNVNAGIYSGDSQPRVISNTVTNAQSTGIEVYSNTCYGGVVQLNKVNNVGAGSDGFQVYCYAAEGPLQFLSNTVNRANYNCFYLYGYLSSGTTSINAVGNKGYDCGEYGRYGDGFFIDSNNTNSGIKLSTNFVQRVAGDGYHVYAPGTVLTANTADSATEDGFDVHTRSVTLTTNKATNNAAVGFEFNWADDPQGLACNGGTTLCPIDGATLTLTGNVATGNAGGACIASTMTSPPSGAGNTFGTPATPAQCSEAEGYVGN